MLDLPAKLTIQTNAMEISKQIQSALGKVKGNINIVSKASTQNVHLLAKDLNIINKQMQLLAVQTPKATHAIKDLANALKVVRSGFTEVEKATAKTSTTVDKVTTDTKQATTVIAQFGEQAALSAKRYSAWIIAVGGGFAVLRATKNAIKESIEFQSTLVKLTQVSGKTFTELKPITNEITRLSTTLGVSSKKLSDVSLVLLQAGLSSRETKKALDALAKVDLAPSFGSIEQAGEAAIAIMHQFGTTTDDLAKQLGAINAVSAEFAVESEDIVTAITRAGSAFGQLAKDSERPKEALNEFIALFTSVRATTRESAETIATGLRTIFTRLQRASTLQFFRNQGIELTNTLTGRFIGLSEAIKRIGEAIKDLPFTDPRVAAIGVELGGYRQINKSIPLITQLEEAQRALNVAKAAGNDLDNVSAQAQESLQVRLQGLEERFLALFRAISESNTFSVLTETFIMGADAAIKIADAIRPLIPLLTAVAAIKFSNMAIEFFPAFRDKLLQTHHAPLAEPSFGGISPLHKAMGGRVPGVGSGDTVPAMLTPGEFVIRKSAVQKLGVNNLHKINKYATGGLVQYMAGGGELEKIGFSTSQAKPNTPATLNKALAKLNEEVEHLIGPFKELGKQTKIIKDNNIRTGGGNANLTKNIIGINSKATVGTVSHEFAHIMEGAIKQTLGLSQLPSNIEGSYANQVASEFGPARLAELQKSGAKESSINYKMQPHELFAEAYSRMSPEQKSIVAYKTQLDPTLKGNVSGNEDLSHYLGPNLPAGSFSPGPFDFSDLVSNSSRMSPKTLASINGQITRNDPFRGFKGAEGSIRGGISRLTGGALSGLQNYSGKFQGFVRGLDSNKIMNAGIAGAVGAPFLFGSVADAKNREERHKGAFGDALTGGFGGLAAGAVTGNPYAAAAGAVLGFTTALIKAEKEIKTADFQESLEKAIEGAKAGKFGGGNLIGDLGAASSNGFLDNLSSLFTSREGISSGLDAIGLKGVAKDIKDVSWSDFSTLLFGGGDVNAKSKTSDGGIIDGQKHAQLIKAHEKELNELLGSEGKNAATGFSSFEAFRKGGKFFGGKNDTGSLQRFEFLSGKSGNTKEGMEAYKKSLGFGTGGTRVDVLKDSIDDDIGHFKKLADALESSVEATKGFSHGLDLAEAALNGKAGTLNLVDRSGLIRNANNATFGETSKELTNLLGGKSGGAKFAAYVNANIGELAGDVKSGRGLGKANTTEALNASFDSLLESFEKQGYAGKDMGGAHDIAGKIRESFTNIIGNNETNLPGKSKAEIEALLGKAYSGLSDALADLSKRLTDNGNELINTFAKTSEAMNNVAHEKFNAAALEVEARNKYDELSGYHGISETTEDAFESYQRTLAGRGGVGLSAVDQDFNRAFNPEHIAKTIAAIENEKANVAATGGSINDIIALNTKSQALVAALNNLKGAVAQNTSIEKQLVDLNTKREEGISLAAEFRGATPEGRARINRGAALTQQFNMGALDIDSLNAEDFNLLKDTISKMKHILPDVEEKFKDRLSVGAFGLTDREEADRQFNIDAITGNMNLSARAIRAGANVQEGQAGVVNAGAIQKFELLNAPLLDQFNQKFEKAVNQLEAIPREFTMTGKHEVNVVINGAEAFAKMQPEMEKFVMERIKMGVNKLTANLRDKGNGPGLPKVNDI